MADDRYAMYDGFSDKSVHSVEWLGIVKNFLKLAFAGDHYEAKCLFNRYRILATTASSWILSVTGCRLMVPAASRSVFQHSSPTTGSGLLVITNAVGSSTWRADVTTLWNASMDETASTYFLGTHGKTTLCKFDPNVIDLLFFMKI
jgi:hypothetical protein